MSFTEVIEKTPTKTQKHNTKIILSPNKRHQVDFPDAWANARPAHGNQNSHETANSEANLPTVTQCYNWTFTKDAIATCFVRDVLDLKPEYRSEFFWLNRVPCRIVRIMGLVVGVQQKEKDTWYTVDDGTGVIDCIIKHPRPSASAEPQKPNSKFTSKADELPPTLPLPLARVGQLVRVQGKVLRSREWFNLRVNEGDINLCAWNEEPLHWKTVVELHKSFYDITGPFKIPSLDTSSLPRLRSPTPTPSLPCASPRHSAETAPSSPAKSDSSTNESRPKAPRLRHPSRLHSRDLTENTFRIYLKHYMDNAPPPPYTPVLSAELDDDVALKTPVKPRRHIPTEATPTQASIKGKSKSNTIDLEIKHGFTLGYLRRVPTLALLASRIVRAERKRRERETRKAEKDKSNTNVRLPLMTQRASSSSGSEPTTKKTKRLFVKAIRDLYSEGSIILWDGPVMPLWSATMEDSGGCHTDDTSGIWKTASSFTSVNTTATSTFSVSTMNYDDPGTLSDPNPSEEAYVSITPSFLGPIVERSIEVLMARAQRHKPRSYSQIQSTSLSCGPTAEAILKDLRNDERWAKLGLWSVEYALVWLVEERRVVEKGGKWELRT